MLEEILNINKPLNWTSFDVCNALKRSYPRKTKIGHAGTLDPLATGVLVVAIGKATKSIPLLQDTSKEYIATVTLGAVTPTYDAEFYPENITPTPNITKSDIQDLLPQFTGKIKQTPPIYSAIMVNGKRAYELARKGVEVELKEREVNIESISIESFECIEGVTIFKIKVRCSKGTYIRTLANDMGKVLGCGAFLSGLVRTAVGDYRIEDSIDLGTLIIKKY
jgi:tRNA pseudouridine55 synthase